LLGRKAIGETLGDVRKAVDRLAEAQEGGIQVGDDGQTIKMTFPRPPAPKVEVKPSEIHFAPVIQVPDGSEKIERAIGQMGEAVGGQVAKALREQAPTKVEITQPPIRFEPRIEVPDNSKTVLRAVKEAVTVLVEGLKQAMGEKQAGTLLPRLRTRTELQEIKRDPMGRMTGSETSASYEYDGEE
jgi:hypothetical protein